MCTPRGPARFPASAPGQPGLREPSRGLALAGPGVPKQGQVPAPSPGAGFCRGPVVSPMMELIGDRVCSLALHPALSQWVLGSVWLGGAQPKGRRVPGGCPSGGGHLSRWETRPGVCSSQWMLTLRVCPPPRDAYPWGKPIPRGFPPWFWGGSLPQGDAHPAGPHPRGTHTPQDACPSGVPLLLGTCQPRSCAPPLPPLFPLQLQPSPTQGCGTGCRASGRCQPPRSWPR